MASGAAEGRLTNPARAGMQQRQSARVCRGFPVSLFPMPAYLKLLIFLAVVFAAGALVAPPIFWGGQALAEAGISGWLAGFPFYRVLSRCLQVSALVLLWPALRWIGLRRPSDLGWRRNPLAARDAAAGFFAAAAVLVAVSAAYVMAGMFALRPEPDWPAMGRIVLTAVAVSGVEEVIFRGVILGLCLWTLPRRGAIFVTTALFAVVHFIKPAKTRLAPEAVQWWSGFSESLRFMDGQPDGWLLVSGLASLFAAGWILGSAAARTRSLWLPIGLHAGWVLTQQSFSLFLKPVPPGGAEAFWPWVGPNLVSGAVPTGVIPLLALAVTGYLVNFYLRHAFRSFDAKIS